MAQRIVGLDIGTSAVRAVELTVDTPSTPVLQAIGQVGLPPGAVVDGEVRDRALVASALRRLWREGGFTERRVHIGLAGTRAITRELELPPLPPAEVDDAVRLQADEILPFPMERTAISSAVTARISGADGTPRIRVLVAAAHRDLIDGAVAAAEAADLEPVGIDLAPAALARALRDPAAASPEVVVSVGAGLTVVAAHEGGTLLFVRTLAMGGDSVSQAVASALDLPALDGEAIKRQLLGPGTRDEQAVLAAAAAVDELVNEIVSSIRFFGTLPGRPAPSRVLVTGGGSRTAGLLGKLGAAMDIPVQTASPLASVDASRLPVSEAESASIDPTIAVPIGLALPEDRGTRFNLLPKEVSGRYAERRARRVLVLCAIALVVILAGATAWRILSIRSTEEGMTSLKTQIHTIDTVEIPRFDKSVRLAREATGLQTRLQPLVKNEVDWLVALNQIGQYLPKSAVLSSLQLTASSTPGGTPGASVTSTAATSSATGAKKVIATGQADITVPAFPQVTTFGESMTKSPVIVDLTITGTLSAGTTSITFPATFGVDATAHGQRLSLFSEKLP
ncbi:MAG: type IV pilus assembly protein PilM [Acidimicrobiales bacterium]